MKNKVKDRLGIIAAVAGKELKGRLDNPASYIALIVFVLLWEFLFFRSIFLAGETSLRLLFDYLPWVLMLFAGASTMGAFAEEKNEGTLELLLTHPVREIDVVFGKFLSNIVWIAVSLAFSLPIAVAFSRFGPLDWGVFAAQFLASLLLTSCLVSLGLFVSSLLKNQIAALLTSTTMSFFLIIAGSEFMTEFLPLSLVPYIENLSLLTHMTSMSRGVIDVQDLWYFISLTGMFIILAYRELLKLKYANRKDLYLPYTIAVFLTIGIVVFSNILSSRIPGRLDLTQGKLYTLSPATIDKLKNLKDIITITVYASSKLPSQFLPVVRDTKDILRDYANVSHNNVTLVYKDPSDDPEISQEAASRGVKEVQFNVVGNEEFQLKTGFLGLIVTYGDRHEAVSFIDQTADLEYQLTSLITQLTIKDKKSIAFLDGHGEKNIYRDYTRLNEELRKQFTIESVRFDEKNLPLASESAVLVIAGPVEKIDEPTKKAVGDFLNEGKSLFLMLDTYQITPQSLTPQPNPGSFSDFVKDLGVTINENIAYDLGSHETISLGTQGLGFLLPYPFWINAQSQDSSEIAKRIESVLIPWGSTLSPDDAKLDTAGFRSQTLLSTTRFGGVQSGVVDLSPEKASFSKENLTEYIVSLALVPREQNDTSAKGKVAIVADSDFLTDQFTQNSPQNLAFGQSVLSWLASDTSLAEIAIKQSQPKKLLFTSEKDPLMIKYGNFILSVIAPGTTGLVRLLRRKKLRQKIYDFSSS